MLIKNIIFDTPYSFIETENIHTIEIKVPCDTVRAKNCRFVLIYDSVKHIELTNVRYLGFESKPEIFSIYSDKKIKITLDFDGNNPKDILKVIPIQNLIQINDNLLYDGSCIIAFFLV